MQRQTAAEETKNVFIVYSALWKLHRQRAFELIGNWNPGKLRLHTDIFPNTKFGLNGKLLITATEVVSIKYQPPHIISVYIY